MTTTALVSGFFPPHRLLRPGTFERAVGWLSAVRRIVVVCGLAGMLGPWALAQASSEHASNSTEDSRSAVSENTGVPVELDGRPILMVYAQIAGFTPQDRAAAIQQRIIALAKRRDIAPEAIRAEDRGRWTEIMAGDERIMGVTEGDADSCRAKPSRPCFRAHRNHSPGGEAISFGSYLAALFLGGCFTVSWQR